MRKTKRAKKNSAIQTARANLISDVDSDVSKAYGYVLRSYAGSLDKNLQEALQILGDVRRRLKALSK